MENRQELASILEVKAFFDYPDVSVFKKEWGELTESEQVDIRTLVHSSLQTTTMSR